METKEINKINDYLFLVYISQANLPTGLITISIMQLPLEGLRNKIYFCPVIKYNIWNVRFQGLRFLEWNFTILQVLKFGLFWPKKWLFNLCSQKISDVMLGTIWRIEQKRKIEAKQN